jgi:hypothetical protein
LLLVRAACGSVTDAQDAIDHVADGNLAQRLRKTLPHVEAARPRMPQVVLLDLPSTSLQPIAEGVFGGIAQGLIPALALGKGCLNAIDEDTAETSEPIERAPLSREFGGARIAQERQLPLIDANFFQLSKTDLGHFRPPIVFECPARGEGHLGRLVGGRVGTLCRSPPAQPQRQASMGFIAHAALLMSDMVRK